MNQRDNKRFFFFFNYTLFLLTKIFNFLKSDEQAREEKKTF